MSVGRRYPQAFVICAAIALCGCAAQPSGDAARSVSAAPAAATEDAACSFSAAWQKDGSAYGGTAESTSCSVDATGNVSAALRITGAGPCHGGSLSGTVGGPLDLTVCGVRGSIPASGSTSMASKWGKFSITGISLSRI